MKLVEKAEQWDANQLLYFFIASWRYFAYFLSIGIVLSIIYAISLPNTYTASAYIVSSEESSASMSSSLASSLSGLGLGNITVGSRGSVNVDKARMRSREFLSAMIEKNNLLPILFEDKWDSDKKKWKTEAPTLIDGYELIDSKLNIYGPTPINEIILVTFDWNDPEIAADWTNLLIEELNLDSRSRKKKEVEESIYFIQEELKKVNLAEIKFSLNELIKSQLKEKVLANVKKEYSFRFIDHAIPPLKKSQPNRGIIVVMGSLLSFALAIFYLLFIALTKETKKINLFKFN